MSHLSANIFNSESLSSIHKSTVEHNHPTVENKINKNYKNKKSKMSYELKNNSVKSENISSNVINNNNKGISKKNTINASSINTKQVQDTRINKYSNNTNNNINNGKSKFKNDSNKGEIAMFDLENWNSYVQYVNRENLSGMCKYDSKVNYNVLLNRREDKISEYTPVNYAVHNKYINTESGTSGVISREFNTQIKNECEEYSNNINVLGRILHEGNFVDEYDAKAIEKEIVYQKESLGLVNKIAYRIADDQVNGLEQREDDNYKNRLVRHKDPEMSRRFKLERENTNKKNSTRQDNNRYERGNGSNSLKKDPVAIRLGSIQKFAAANGVSISEACLSRLESDIRRASSDMHITVWHGIIYSYYSFDPDRLLISNGYMASSIANSKAPRPVKKTLFYLSSSLCIDRMCSIYNEEVSACKTMTKGRCSTIASTSMNLNIIVFETIVLTLLRISLGSVDLSTYVEMMKLMSKIKFIESLRILDLTLGGDVDMLVMYLRTVSLVEQMSNSFLDEFCLDNCVYTSIDSGRRHFESLAGVACLYMCREFPSLDLNVAVDVTHSFFSKGACTLLERRAVEPVKFKQFLESINSLLEITVYNGTILNVHSMLVDNNRTYWYGLSRLVSSEEGHGKNKRVLQVSSFIMMYQKLDRETIKKITPQMERPTNVTNAILEFKCNWIKSGKDDLSFNVFHHSMVDLEVYEEMELLEQQTRIANLNIKPVDFNEDVDKAVYSRDDLDAKGKLFEAW